MENADAAAYAAKLEDHLFDQTIKSFDERQVAENSANAVGPNLPPPPKQSIDELAAELKRHPFFATSAEDLGEENPEFEALKALAYEGTRAEIAENFHEQGNDAAKAKDWSNAKEYYSKAIAALESKRKNDEIDELSESNPDWELQEETKERDLKERCLSNRSLCHLKLENYRSCSIDCIAALELSPRNIKAHYRLGQALLALNRLEEANKTVTAGLEVDIDNTFLRNLKETIQKTITIRNDKTEKRKAEEERRKKEDTVLKTALAARQIKSRTTGAPPDVEDAKISLTPDPLAPTSSLVFPVIILYPMHAQTDFIKSFGEEQTLLDHLQYLLPLPWDHAGEYGTNGSDRTEAYVETSSGGLVKWGKKVELLKILTGGKIEVVDGLVTVNIVPKARSLEWVNEFKRRKVK